MDSLSKKSRCIVCPTAVALSLSTRCDQSQPDALCCRTASLIQYPRGDAWEALSAARAGSIFVAMCFPPEFLLKCYGPNAANADSPTSTERSRLCAGSLSRMKRSSYRSEACFTTLPDNHNLRSWAGGVPKIQISRIENWVALKPRRGCTSRAVKWYSAA